MCRDLGADIAINYREQDFVDEVQEATDGAGPTSSSTTWARSTSTRNVDALATEGRLVVIGMQGGTKAELDLSPLLRKRAAVIATTLRSRPAEKKAAICAAVEEHVWPLVADGPVKPIVHAAVPPGRGGRRPPGARGRHATSARSC